MRDNPALGVLLLLGRLTRAQRPVTFLDWVAHPHWTPDQLADRAARRRAVFFSANSLNWAVVLDLARRIHARSPSTRLCVGGPHPTLFPDSVRAVGIFDAAFRGEAETEIVSLYDALVEGRRVRLPGVVPLADGLSVEADGDAVASGDADGGAWLPDYHRLLPGRYHNLPVETSRGCHFKCTFCAIPGQGAWRGTDVAEAVERLNLADRHRHRVIDDRLSVVDDAFTADPERVTALCGRLPARFHRRLLYDATVASLKDDAMVEALEPFTASLLVGAEVATVADARRLRKPVTPVSIRAAARRLARYGAADRSVFSFILGLPWQDAEDCRETVRFAADLSLEYGVLLYLQWYWPLPGSQMWRDAASDRESSLEEIDRLGFFEGEEWFFRDRKITPGDVKRIDDFIAPIQLLLNLRDQGRKRHSVQYAPPRFQDHVGADKP